MRGIPLRSLRVWATVSVLSLVAATVAIAVVASVERSSVERTQKRIQSNLRPAQNAEAALLTAFVNQETGQRGFLLTGNDAFLDPYDAGRRDAVTLQRQLVGLTEGDARETALLQSAWNAGRAWQVQSAEPEIAARRAGTINAAQLQRFAATGKQLFDAFRAQMSGLMERTGTLVAGELAHLTDTQHDARIASDITLALALVVAALAITLFWYVFTRPIGQFLGEIQAVAGGDYTRPLQPRGPEEVRIVARAVDQMRDGLVATSAEAVANQQLLSVRQERDRMATDLHDLTIQRIFGLGLALNAVTTRTPELSADLDPLVDETDAIIRELRNVIFALGASEEQLGVRAAVIETVRDSARSFGFLPELDLRGPIDTGLSPELGADLLAVLREALSNAARHSHASSVHVLVSYADDTVNLVVTDDGKGLSDGVVPGDGTINLRRRAERRGGSATIRTAPTGGTVVHWWAPVH